MPEKWVRFTDFGGQKDYAPPMRLPSIRSPECLNAEIRDDNMIQKQKGVRDHCPDVNNFVPPLPALARCYSDQAAAGTQLAKCMIALYPENSFVLYVTDAGAVGAVSGMQALGFTEDIDIMRVVQWKGNRVYIALSDTKHAFRWGLDHGDDTSTRSAFEMMIDPYGSGGTLANSDETEDAAITAGWYCCAVTACYGPAGAWGQSIISARSAAFEITAGMVTNLDWYKLTGIPTRDDDSIGNTKIYMTEPQGSEADAEGAGLFFVSDLDPDTSSFLWDDDSAPTDLDTPAPTADTTGSLSVANRKIEFLEVHNSRLFLAPHADKSTIHYSNADKPDEFSQFNKFGILADCNGMRSYKGHLVIGTRPMLLVLRGWSPKEFQSSLDKASIGRGVLAPDSMAVLNIMGQPMMPFVAEDGIWAFDDSTTHHIGRDIQNTFLDIPKENRAAMVGIAHQDRYILQYNDGSNYKHLIFDGRRGEWFPGTKPIRAFCHWNGADDSGELYCTYETPCRIYEMEKGYDLAEFIYTFPTRAPFGPEEDTQYSAIKIEVHRDDLPIRLIVTIDGEHNDSVTFPAPPSAAKFGKRDTYGNVRYGGLSGRYVTAESSLADNMVGRNVSVKLQEMDTRNKRVLGVYLLASYKGRSNVA